MAELGQDVPEEVLTERETGGKRPDAKRAGNPGAAKPEKRRAGGAKRGFTRGAKSAIIRKNESISEEQEEYPPARHKRAARFAERAAAGEAGKSPGSFCALAQRVAAGIRLVHVGGREAPHSDVRGKKGGNARLSPFGGEGFFVLKSRPRGRSNAQGKESARKLPEIIGNSKSRNAARGGKACRLPAADAKGEKP